MKARYLSCLQLLLLTFWAFSSSAAEVQQLSATYTFAVVPQYGPAQLHREWLPLIQRISRESGINLELRIAASIPKFEAEFTKGKHDFAYMNPYHAIMAKHAQGYLPLLRDSQQLTGILLVRRDSPYHSVRDLNGETIGFPAPNAFGASLYMRALLTERFKINFDSRYLNTHANVYRHVAQGNVAAGGGVNLTFNDESSEVRGQLRVLYQTPGVAAHPVVVHPRVPQRVREAVTAAFLSLQHDAAGRQMLKEIRTPQPVKANYEQDFYALERLGIQKYVVPENE
ncbi:MAG: phosphate/phosphite/phosphonate ABC transporter substrate-binding protein [Sterolibacterium sp.]|nr:phosphate/phosphite/phosphonate ABC transporter substrate-binding protein [Sterolibacterium sp.]